MVLWTITLGTSACLTTMPTGARRTHRSISGVPLTRAKGCCLNTTSTLRIWINLVIIKVFVEFRFRNVRLNNFTNELRLPSSLFVLSSILRNWRNENHLRYLLIIDLSRFAETSLHPKPTLKRAHIERIRFHVANKLFDRSKYGL